MQTPNRTSAQARVTQNYDSMREPERGYLGVAFGTMIRVHLGTRSPPEPRNSFQCDYIFACLQFQMEIQGWIPMDILALPDRLCKHYQRHENDSRNRGCDRSCCHRSHAPVALCYEWARCRRCPRGQECKFKHGLLGQQPGQQQQRQEQEQERGKQTPPPTLQELLSLALIESAKLHPDWFVEGTAAYRRIRALLHPDNELTALGAVNLQVLKKTASDSVFSKRPSGSRG